MGGIEGRGVRDEGRGAEEQRRSESPKKLKIEN
jgi:hypothetical protein